MLILGPPRAWTTDPGAINLVEVLMDIMNTHLVFPHMCGTEKNIFENLAFFCICGPTDNKVMNFTIRFPLS